MHESDALHTFGCNWSHGMKSLDKASGIHVCHHVHLPTKQEDIFN